MIGKSIKEIEFPLVATILYYQQLFGNDNLKSSGLPIYRGVTIENVINIKLYIGSLLAYDTSASSTSLEQIHVSNPKYNIELSQGFVSKIGLNAPSYIPSME